MITTKLRTLTHRPSKKGKTWRKNLFRTPSLIDEASELNDLPAIIAEPGGKPLVEQKLKGVTVEKLYKALETEAEGGPLAQFLRDIVQVEGLSTTPWLDGVGVPGSLVMRKRYKAPLPADTPEVLRRALGLPAAVQGTTMSCLRRGDNKLILVQRSWSEGVLYSDRLRIQHTHVFTDDAQSGGVEWKQWSQTIWLKPLPWSQGFVGKLIEQRALHEAKVTAHKWADTVLEATSPDPDKRAGA